MSASCCGGDKTCPWNKFVAEVQADAKPKPMVFAKAMAPSAAEAHRLAVAHHAKLCQAATQAVKAGLVSSAEAARWDSILGHRQAALEASRPKLCQKPPSCPPGEAIALSRVGLPRANTSPPLLASVASPGSRRDGILGG